MPDPLPSIDETRPPRPLLDVIRLQAMIYEEAQRIRDLLFNRLLEPALAGEAPGDATTGLLLRLRLLLLKHPVAAQAAFSALVAEGRSFAATPEGAAWKSALASSDLVRRGQRLWDAISFNILEEDPGTIVPSAYLDALLRAAEGADVDDLLRRIRGERHDAPR